MAITKLMNIKDSKTGKIDVHLKNSINYIQNPKKLGAANLAGGINCLPALAYEQMKSTKELFGKTGGRQGYHYVLSFKSGEGTPEMMHDVAMRFAEKLFHNEYEVVIAVHTDRNHIHAHLVFNSVNMVTGYKYQYHNGDWKRKIHPITNELCGEYGLHITPAEYSEEPKNVSRPQWEKEQQYNQLIKDDVWYCAMRAESMEHFLFLIEKLGYEVKDGAHIAVKALGMKRFRRIDTLNPDFTKENLETLIKYAEPQNASRKNVISSYVFAKLTPMQKKYYAKLYRRQGIVKQPFKHHSAYLQEEIQKMHKLQEEYLLLAKYDVKDFGDVVKVIDDLWKKKKLLEEQQKEMYAERNLQKRQCKDALDIMKFEAGAEAYHEKLDQIKADKKAVKAEQKVVRRIFQREMSDFEEQHENELANLIDIGAMEDDNIGCIGDVEIPENPYRQAEVIQMDESDIDPHYADSSQKEVATAADTGIEDRRTLPKTKAEYVSLSVTEKLERFQFDNISADEARKIVSDYLETIHYSDYPGDIFEESWAIAEACEKAANQIQETKHL